MATLLEIPPHNLENWLYNEAEPKSDIKKCVLEKLHGAWLQKLIQIHWRRMADQEEFREMVRLSRPPILSRTL